MTKTAGDGQWRDLAALGADLVFETDAAGRFVFVAPDPVLGWPAASLHGQDAAELLAEPGAPGGFDPFRPAAPVRHRRAWLKRAGGGSACVSFAAIPLLDAAGVMIGARGAGQDVTAAERREEAVAGVLRRGQVIDHILSRMRAEVAAPRMMQAALEPLAHATGCEAAAVVDVIGDGALPAVLHAHGTIAPATLAAAIPALAAAAEAPRGAEARDGRALLAAVAETRFGELVGVLLCRAPGARPWDHDDRALLSAVAVLLRTILEHGAIQREMARQARTDPLTGLHNRRAFMDELTRRIDRLETEGLPGALLFIDLDHFGALNENCGHEAGDEALRRTAQLLRASTRPTDLIARLGADAFAVWLDGADPFAAAERAEALRLAGPAALRELAEGRSLPVTLSIAVAARWSGEGEDVAALFQRADQAMAALKAGGRGHWRAARPGEAG